MRVMKATSMAKSTVVCMKPITKQNGKQNLNQISHFGCKSYEFYMSQKSDQ